jgi:hypothetical protein
MARRKAFWLDASSSGVRSQRSRSSRSPAISNSRSIELRRLTSVGCAVSTAPQKAVAKNACNWARESSAVLARASACAIVPSRGGELAMACARTRRM